MKWNKDNLHYSDSEEFKYMDYLDDVYEAATSIKDNIAEIDNYAYGDIVCCREINKINLDGVLAFLKATNVELEGILGKLKNK